jgi:NAD(P)-dependent dehydrogenase (short-subunit alcohol dehydrogenase family)
MIEGGHILVTGASGVLGQAVVEGLSARGAQVIALARGEAPVGGISGVDLNDAQALAAAMATVREGTERLVGLVNIAGGFSWEKVEGGSLDTWDRLYRINLRSAVAATQAALPLLKAGRGAIVNVGSAAAAKAGVGMAAYAASKAGVVKLTESLAEELKTEGVRVNAVLPSIIDTPVNRADMPKADISRWVTPSALERVIAFLLSEDSEAVTGACIPVTGRT